MQNKNIFIGAETEGIPRDRFQEIVNYFRKNSVNHIRKRAENYHPNSGKDI